MRRRQHNTDIASCILHIVKIQFIILFTIAAANATNVTVGSFFSGIIKKIYRHRNIISGISDTADSKGANIFCRGKIRFPEENKIAEEVFITIINTAKKCMISIYAPVKVLQLHCKKLLFFVLSVIVIFVTVYFYRSYHDRNRFVSTTRLSIMDKEVRRACNYIEDHYDDPDLNLESLCSSLVTGGAFLEALFKKELGLSVEDFIKEVRINRAKIIISKKPDLPVEELARLSGYADKNVFLIHFEAVMGATLPSYLDLCKKRHNEAA